MEISIGMTREGLRKFAAQITAECDRYPEGEGIEITRYIEHNGSGPELTLKFGNDDMEGEHISSPDAAYWDEG